jgi:hypothetical protein
LGFGFRGISLSLGHGAERGSKIPTRETRTFGRKIATRHTHPIFRKLLKNNRLCLNKNPTNPNRRTSGRHTLPQGLPKWRPTRAGGDAEPGIDLQWLRFPISDFFSPLGRQATHFRHRSPSGTRVNLPPPYCGSCKEPRPSGDR